MWRRGWCRNPRLYAPQQSHLVDQDSLDCSRGLGSAWEPVDAAADQPPHPSAMSTRQPLRLFAPQPQLAPAGLGFVASSSAGGSGAGGGSFSGPPRPDRTDPPTGQERTVSYQPEERYWTDYLRIALPVIGLLLLIGLFWYWANSIIGDGDDDEPTSTTVALANVDEINAPATPPPPTATAASLTPAAGAPPASTPTPPTQQRTAQQPSNQDAAEVETPAVAPAQDQQPSGQNDAEDSQPPPGGYPTYPVGTTVVTTAEVNMRDAATTEGNVVSTLPAGTSLEITGPFEDAGELDWWPVSNPATNQTGFVREDFLEAQDQAQ